MKPLHNTGSNMWIHDLRVITFMESVEDWTLDGNPEFEQAMNELGQRIG